VLPSVEPLQLWFIGQVELSVGSVNLQPCASTWQSDCTLVLEQKVPVPVQAAGAELQVHAAAPAAPVHVWCMPQAACVVCTVTQPCASATQVVSPPASQYVPAPFEQIAGAGLQVQEAEPAAPVHASFAVQAAGVPFSKKQLFVSCAQVASWPLPSQYLPTTLQGAVLHAQTPEPLQVWCAPQAVVVCAKMQLLASFAQWADDELDVQRSPTVEPQVVSTTQPQAPEPEAPVHAWCVPHATGAAAKRQPFVSFVQVETLPLVAQNVDPSPLPHSVGGKSQPQ